MHVRGLSFRFVRQVSCVGISVPCFLWLMHYIHPAFPHKFALKAVVARAFRAARLTIHIYLHT